MISPWISRTVLKRLFYRLLYLLRLDAVYLRKLHRGGFTVVLNLHRVSPHANPFYPPLHPADFESLLVFVRDRFDVTVFGELNATRNQSAQRGSSLPSLVLSFDDGYYDFLDYALPALRKHGLRANMNVIGSCLGSGEPIWNLLLYDSLAQAPTHLIDRIVVPGLTAANPGDADGKLRFAFSLARFLKSKSRAEREPLWRDIKAVLNQFDFTATRMMNVAEVRQITAEVEIGCHSFSHEKCFSAPTRNTASAASSIFAACSPSLSGTNADGD